MPEVSDQELMILRNARALLDRLWESPEHGTAVKKAVKSMFPDRSIPEVDVPAQLEQHVADALKPVIEKVDSALGRVDKWETEQRERSEDAALRSQLSAVQNKHKLSDESMNKIITRMKEKNNPDVEAAAALFMQENPPPAAKPISGSGFAPQAMNLFDVKGNSEEADVRLLHTDPLSFFDREVQAVMDEFNQAA